MKKSMLGVIPKTLNLPFSDVRESGFEDFYVWRDADPTGGPPNNWKSVFGGSAWEMDNTRGQYYLHNFLAEQPDLNLRNAEVVKKLKEALKFWLDLGVDGFRVDGVAFFFEGMNDIIFSSQNCLYF